MVDQWISELGGPRGVISISEISKNEAKLQTSAQLNELLTSADTYQKKFDILQQLDKKTGNEVKVQQNELNCL